MRLMNRLRSRRPFTGGLRRLAGLLLVLAMVPGPAVATPDAPLIEAVRQGNAPAVRTLLGDRDVNAREAGGATALHWAVRLDRLDLAELLIAAGADVAAANAFDVTPLSLAAVNGSAEMLELLLEAGADPNVTMAGSEAAILTAARTGRVDAVRTLVAHGADVNAAQAAGQTPLMWAAAEGHVETLQALIDAGAVISARTAIPETPLRTGLEGPAPHGFTALLFAVRAGHIDAVRVLLDAGADVNDELPDGMSTVVLAATNAHWELGVHLVDRGADPDGAAQGWTALHAMTWVRMPNFGFNPPGPVTTGSMDSLAFARAMVERGADVDARMTAEPRNGYRNALNRIGATPLLMAARLADAPLMRVLVELGRRSDGSQRGWDHPADGGVRRRHPLAGRGPGHRGRGAGLRRAGPGAGRRPERDGRRRRDRAARGGVPRRQLHRRAAGRSRREHVRRRERLRLDAAADSAGGLPDRDLQGSPAHGRASGRADGRAHRGSRPVACAGGTSSPRVVAGASGLRSPETRLAQVSGGGLRSVSVTRQAHFSLESTRFAIEDGKRPSWADRRHGLRARAILKRGRGVQSPGRLSVSIHKSAEMQDRFRGRVRTKSGWPGCMSAERGVTVQESHPETLDEIREVLDGRRTMAPQVRSRTEVYAFIERTAQRFDYGRLGKADKGVLRHFLGMATGRSRAQVTRLLKQYREAGRLADRRHAPSRPFSRRYTSDDIELLAEVDALHGTLSGPATRKLCARAYHVFGDLRFERLAGISNGHLYNLRRSTTYRRRRQVADPTPTCPMAVGRRWRPQPFGQPGHLRVVSVGQGDLDSFERLHHLELVDEATRFRFIGSVEHLGASCLAPFLDDLVGAFPFTVRGFHAGDAPDHGAGEVAALLQALRGDAVSRACRGTGSAPVGSRNGGDSRRQVRNVHVSSACVERVNGFTRRVLSPYLNYHRLCFFPSERVDATGRVRKRYRDADVMTPYERLKSLPGAAGYLTPGTTFARLDAVATAMSDGEAVHSLSEAGVRLFRSH